MIHNAIIMSTELPDTPLIAEAMEVVGRSLSLPIMHHSQRTFLLGQAYAAAKNISFDEEDLLLAALFHDLGLTDSFADRKRPFTEIGGDYLERFLADRGVPERGRCLAEAIDLHMQLFPRWSKGPVIGLLQMGAWMDVSRRRLRHVGRTRVDEIEATYPRGEFESEFRPRLRRSFGSFRACGRLLFPKARSRSVAGIIKTK